MIYHAQKYTLLFTVLGMLLWAGCSDIVHTPDPNIKGNGLRISISADAFNGRTLLPNQVFTKYVLSFSGPSGHTHEDVTLNGNTTSIVVNDLVLGRWTVTATGYVEINEQEYAAAEGSAEVEVVSKQTKNCTINISARQNDGVNGFFSYSVNYPANKVNYGSITIDLFGGGRVDSNDLRGYNTSGSFSLAPGYYVMTISLSNNYETAVRTEIVHIYSNMETKAAYPFSEDDFTKLVIVSGSITTTVNHKPPESAYIYAYLKTASGYQIGSSWVDLSAGRWSMEIPAFDEETPLYFRVTAVKDECYDFQKEIEGSVRIKDQNVTKDFGTVNIEAITLSGTINATYDGKPMTTIRIQVYNNTDSNFPGSSTSLSSPTAADSWSITRPAFNSSKNITFKVRGTYYSQGNGEETVFNKFVDNTVSAFNGDVPGIAINLNIPNSYAPANAISLAADTWVNGNIAAPYNLRWYSISVTRGTTYRLWWRNDSVLGNSNTRLYYVDVYAWYQNGAIIPLADHGSAWSYPVSFTAASNTTVYFRVRASDGEDATGDYAIAYSAGTRRPEIGTFTGGLANKLTYIRNNADNGDIYGIILENDESIGSQDLSYNYNNVSITLSGKDTERTIFLDTDYNGNMFYVGSGVTLTLGNNVTLKGHDYNYYSPLVNVSNGTLIMNTGSKITGNTAYYSNGGGVYVSSDGTFTMNGGTISGNTAYYSGGGVNISSGTFTMKGGTISGNTASSSGGGVYVSSDGTFTMNGGTISGNTAYYSGGGVNISSGTFTKTGGTINGYNAGNNSNTVKDSSGIVQEDQGHAVYASNGTITKYRETTAGSSVKLSWDKNSLPIFGGDWDN